MNDRGWVGMTDVESSLASVFLATRVSRMDGQLFPHSIVPTLQVPVALVLPHLPMWLPIWSFWPPSRSVL